MKEADFGKVNTWEESLKIVRDSRDKVTEYLKIAKSYEVSLGLDENENMCDFYMFHFKDGTRKGIKVVL